MGFPASQFFCCLNDQPDHLVPVRYLRDEARAREDGDFRLNPACVFVEDGHFPETLPAPAHLENFALGGLVAWVKNARTEVLEPFWLSSELAAWLMAAQAGGLAATNLPLALQQVLPCAGILVNHDGGATQSRWEITLSHARELFREKSYAPMARLIHPFHLSALRRYYRRMIRVGAIALGDSQSSQRYVAHNESVARFFHHQLSGVVSAVVGEAVKPSYVYLASYQSGAELEQHTDREQCEVSVSFCLDYSPEPRLQTPWPLVLQTPAAKVEVFQAIGDGLIYRGRELPHSRSKLAQGHTSTSLFFHYVRKSFPGPLD